MKKFFSVLEECLEVIDRGGDLESYLAAYPDYEELLRTFIQLSLERREQPEANPEPALEQVPFDQALDECIKAVGKGKNPANCYKRYPSYARKMKPWLDAVVDLRRQRKKGRLQPVTSPDKEVIPEVPFTQALEEYLQALQQKKADVILERYPYYAQKIQFWADQVPHDSVSIFTSTKPVVMSRPPIRVGDFLSRMSLRMSVAASLALFFFLFSGLSLANAATATLPGDSLYPLKLTIEQVQLNLGSNDQQAELKARYSEERRRETSILIQVGRKQDVVFDGEITSVDQNTVMVSNVTVLLDGVNDKLPTLQKGEKVHIEGYTGQKGVVIKKINLHSSSGEITTFVAATSAPTLAEVAFSPTPIFTVQASITPSLVPTEVPTLVPTWTSTDVPTVVPTWTPTGVPTLMPTWTPTEVPTLKPTWTPTDVPTLAPTWTPTDVPTLAPTWTPTDVPTLAPTWTPTEIPTITPTLESTIITYPTNTQP